MNASGAVLNVLHTSDWHLGCTLYRRSRHRHFELFLDWLLEVIRRENVHVLLVAGDIFDGIAPGIRTQELYYGFLGRVMETACRHVVIVAGNHDSPSFLEAPKSLLYALRVHVVGVAGEDEVLLLKDEEGQPELIVCAVPFLRDRDVRSAAPGESPEEKERQLVEGVCAHYARAAERAAILREACGGAVPVIATGHLFAAGGRVEQGDGVRDLYVGSLARIPAEAFPPNLEYVALGHLHSPQLVAGLETRRYSGSPLPVGFGEARQEKSVALAHFAGGRLCGIETLAVPCFQRLVRLTGTAAELERGLEACIASGEPAWVEAVCDDAVTSALRDRLQGMAEGTAAELLCLRSSAFRSRMLADADEGERLEELTVDDVFERCLESCSVPDEERPALRQTFAEALHAMNAASEEVRPCAS